MPKVVIILLTLLASAQSAARAQVPQTPPNIITVGVRADARPFSYRQANRLDQSTLNNYSGYMIEICRKVLSELIVRGPFRNFVVEEREVTASNRWHELETGQIDMLCGPDSITLDRLKSYNASHPLFLSGITFVSTSDAHFPIGRYCGPVVGLLKDTTAETEGLRVIAESGNLGRFDSALDIFLVLAADRTQEKEAGVLLLRFEDFVEDVLSDEEVSLVARERSKATGVTPEDVKTDDCPSGFDEGPVVFYETHQQGIKDLCNGKILYYVADVDMLSRRLDSCKHTVHRETLTHEAYGIFFRRDKSLPKSQTTGTESTRDSTLYAEFNNVLLRKMQRTENILDYEFSQEFKDEEPTEDLRRFFENYKFASDF